MQTLKLFLLLSSAVILTSSLFGQGVSTGDLHVTVMTFGAGFGGGVALTAIFSGGGACAPWQPASTSATRLAALAPTKMSTP